MSNTRLITVCDKCGKEDNRLLRSLDREVSVYWKPPKWQLHNTEDGDGSEPNKVFMLCDECERQFELSVRDFQPKAKS